MTGSDTHADTIRRTLVSVGRWAASIDEPTAAVEHGCLDALAALNALDKELDDYDGRLLAVGETADRERARADQAETALRQIADTSPNWMQMDAVADSERRMREIARDAISAEPTRDG